jgi:hypothetical protein
METALTAPVRLNAHLIVYTWRLTGGNFVADLSRLYQWPKGESSQFDDPGAYVSVNQT